MQMLIDFLPLVLALVAYKLEGIYAATIVLMVALLLLWLVAPAVGDLPGDHRGRRDPCRAVLARATAASRRAAATAGRARAARGRGSRRGS